MERRIWEIAWKLQEQHNNILHGEGDKVHDEEELRGLNKYENYEWVEGVSNLDI